MKYFYLRFTQDDFNKEASSWVTDTIDLYNNTQYKNYSIHKSRYGLNLIGDNTWTGLNDYGDGATSSGFLENDRFVDTTGKIDVTRHYIDIGDYVGENLDYEIKYYSSEYPEDRFPDLWETKTIPRGRHIFRMGIQPYARFEIVWGDNFDPTNLEIEYIVEVQISEPRVNAMFDRTRGLLNVFPEWTALRDDSIEPEDPALATPNSVGGSLINAVVGEPLEDLRSTLIYLRSQMFLTTADVSQKAWIYMVEGLPNYIFSVKGDGVELARAADAREFYTSDADDDVAFFMNIGNMMWLNKDYAEILVNDEPFEAKATHVWNWFDEHGLLFDLRRHHLEDNDSYRKRILDVFINQPTVDLEGLKRSLRRELNLWLTYDDATPDSYALGATPTIIEIEDIQRSQDYFDPDGMPTQKMRDLVLWLAETYPSTWGFLRWGNALWNTGGENDVAYSALPWRFDAETDVPLDAGVGDLDDLYVYRPDEIVLTTPLEYRLQIKGLRREIKQEYREASMQVQFTARADVEYYRDRAQGDITVWVTANGVTYWTQQTLDTGEIRANTPITDRAEASISLFDPQGLLRKQYDWGVDGSDEIVFSQDNANEDIEVPLEDVTDIAVSWGWDFDLSSVTPANPPVDGYGYLVFSEDATPSILNANDDGTRLHADNLESDIILVAAWDNSEIQVETQTFNEHTIPISMNGAPPNNAIEDAIYTTPITAFPEMAIEETKTWVLEVYTVNGDGVGVATSSDAQGNPIEIPITNIEVNGSTAWNGNVMEIDYDEENRDLVFSTLDTADYPSEYEEWYPFTADSIETYEGVVDENGAWLGGVRPDIGQTNTRLRYHVLDRDDFNIPNTDDYVTTWMGVTHNQVDSVVVYLDTNTVKPAHTMGNLEYPDNAIVEAWDEDDQRYVYSEFYSNARKIQRANPQWNPFLNSGWLFDKEDEYYVYAEKAIENFITPTFQLATQTNLGAPIIVRSNEATPVEYRQVAFIEDYATPNLTDTNIEMVSGNGTANLYLAYEDVFDVSVVNLYTGQDITLDVASATNVLEVSEVTQFDVEYAVEYKVNRSFIVEHGIVNDDGDLTTEIRIIETAPINNYTVVYEASEYNFATPVDIALNPAYTLTDEGFIFVCFDEFEYSTVQIKLSPGTLGSTSEDYALLSLVSRDEHGNIKADQTFTVSTTWGELSETEITTDNDGHAFAILSGVDDTAATYGEVSVYKDAVLVGTIGFNIGQVAPETYKLIALPAANSMPADGSSTNFIYGRVIEPSHLPVPHAVINYRRGESVQELFQEDYIGQTVADANGRFTIGPIIAATPNNPRTVFFAVESWGITDDAPATPGEVATPNYDMDVEYGPIGDVVYWREFPDVTKALNEYNLLSLDTFNQHQATLFAPNEAFPLGHDEATPTLDATPNLALEWEPPEWYAMSAYKQYQLGLRGDFHHQADYYYEGSHPDYKEF